MFPTSHNVQLWPSHFRYNPLCSATWEWSLSHIKIYFLNQTVNDHAVCSPLSKMIWSLSMDRLFHHGSFLITSLRGLVNLLLCVNNAESSSSHTSVLENVTFVSPVLTIGLSLVRHILQFDPWALQTHDFWHINILTLIRVSLSDQV